MSQRFATDVLIIGGGAAGRSRAATGRAARVTVLSKGDITTGSSHWAQGGVAAVMDPEDSYAAHVTDTVEAGAGLCDPEVVKATVADAPDIIAQLSSWGVNFDVEDNTLHLTREGGHSHRRVVHRRRHRQGNYSNLDQKALDHPNIELFNDRIAIDLISLSKWPLPKSLRWRPRIKSQYRRVEVFQSKFVILATGGASKFISIPATQMAPPATASLWHGGQVVVLRIWNSTSSILLAYITPMRALS